MNGGARILVVAATARELAPADGWLSLACGAGPVESAIATGAAIATLRPAAVLHVGIAGARRSAALPAASLVIGREARYCDLAVPEAWAPHIVPADATLLAAAQHAFPSAPLLTIGTSARVGGTTGCDVEAMEGFGVLRAAQQAGIPALEVRAVSSEIEEPDRARWHFDAAFAAITAATPPLVAAITRSQQTCAR